MQWSVEQLQMAIFYKPSVALDAYQTWLSLFQSSPDSYQRHSDPSLRSSQASGANFGYNWIAQNAPGRTDILINGAPQEGAGLPADRFPLLSNDDIANSLLIERLPLLQLDQLGVLRVAMVVQFVKHVDTLDHAADLFFQESRVPRVESGATDLIFALNYRRQLPTTGVLANRLCRWQTIEKQFVAMQIGSFNDVMPPVLQPAVALNVDINTVPQQIPFKASQVSAIARDLQKEVKVIRDNGYSALIG